MLLYLIINLIIILELGGLKCQFIQKIKWSWIKAIKDMKDATNKFESWKKQGDDLMNQIEKEKPVGYEQLQASLKQKIDSLTVAISENKYQTKNIKFFFGEAVKIERIMKETEAPKYEPFFQEIKDKLQNLKDAKQGVGIDTEQPDSKETKSSKNKP